MDTHQDHKITVCTSCKRKGTQQRPGYELIEKLRGAIRAADDAATNDFDVAGVACMAGCERPCAVAYHGTGKATYLFGDMDPAEDVGDLLTFANHYAALDDGWCSSLDRPGKLRTSTLARVPSLVAAPLPTAARAS